MTEQDQPPVDTRETLRLRDTLRFLWDEGHYLPFAFAKRSMMTVNDRESEQRLTANTESEGE